VALPVGILADAIGERLTIVLSGFAVLAVIGAFQMLGRRSPPPLPVPADPEASAAG
jgi:hypothetical protein